MRRTFHGKTVQIDIVPSGKDQSEVGMFVELERNNWKNHLFVPDSTLARLVGREMYYSLVSEFFPNDFQSRPGTPMETNMVYKRIRRKSSSSRMRKTPNEVGIEAEPYDKFIVDSIENSSTNADIGESRLRVERSVFQSIQTQECDLDSAENLWWDIKYKLTLIIVCLKYSLIKIDHNHNFATAGDIFDVWRTLTGFSDKELYYAQDNSLTQLGQAIADAISRNGILYRLISTNKSDSFLQEDALMIQSTSSMPEIDGQMAINIDQSRTIQVILVVILFGVLVAGVGSFIMENRKVMGMLEKIHEKCKS
jgi:hypothetical protein